MKNILKHKTLMIVCVLVSAVLVFAYFWGGNAPAHQKTTQTQDYVEEKSENQKDLSMQADTEASNQETEISKPEAEKDSINAETQPTESLAAQMDVSEAKAGELTCTLTVRCDTALQNISWLDEGKLDIVPENGVIFAEKEVVFYEGESVFNVTLREMKKNKIHFEYMNTPIYKSAYIEGIANLYEFDCGELSGWVYKVNDSFPSFGSSRCMLNQGDKIEWLYTCDLGLDVGSHVGMQKDE